MTESAAQNARHLASLLELAPGWVRVGLAAPTERVRKDAVAYLSEYLATGLDQVHVDAEQLALPF